MVSQILSLNLSTTTESIPFLAIPTTTTLIRTHINFRLL